jgi:hypothetical protein
VFDCNYIFQLILIYSIGNVRLGFSAGVCTCTELLSKTYCRNRFRAVKREARVSFRRRKLPTTGVLILWLVNIVMLMLFRVDLHDVTSGETNGNTKTTQDDYTSSNGRS